MVTQPSIPPEVATDSEDQVSPLPTQFPAAPVHLVTEFPAQLADRAATGSQVRVRTHAIRQVVVLQVASRLKDVVEDLDRTIQQALADGPRGVVCDLSGVIEGTDPDAFEELASAGRHVRDWPGTPVAVACPDPQMRSALAAHPLGKYLIVTASMLPALSAVLSTPTSAVQWLRLPSHPTAPRASRDFVTRTLLDWRLGRLILSANLMVGELVASSLVSASTDIDLSIAWNLGVLRLTVRDHGDDNDNARRRHPYLDLNVSRLPVVAGLSRAFGVLPTADGGKAVWAVLNVPQPPQSTGRRRSEPAATTQESSRLADVRDLAGLPFCVRSSAHPPGRPLPQHRKEAVRFLR